MKCKLSVIIYDRMSGIGSTLKTDDDICLFCQHICNLTFSFVAPVSAYNCFYHSSHSPFSRNSKNQAARRQSLF